jgi:hypothetical protein
MPGSAAGTDRTFANPQKTLAQGVEWPDHRNLVPARSILFGGWSCDAYHSLTQRRRRPDNPDSVPIPRFFFRAAPHRRRS